MNINDIKGEEIHKLFPEATEVDNNDNRKLYSVKDENNESVLLETNKHDKILSIINESELEELKKQPLKQGIILHEDEDEDTELFIRINR